MKLIKVKKADVRFNPPISVATWLKKNKGRQWNSRQEFERQFEKETDYEVLGVFNTYTNITDPWESDGEEYAIPVMKEGSKIVVEVL